MPKDESHYLDRVFSGHLDEPIETLAKPLLIEVAPTGSFLSRDINPNQPYTANEVADQVVAACDAGASIAHLHVRHQNGVPDQRPATIAETIDRIREHHDPVTTINVLSNLDGAYYGRPLLEETIGEFVDQQGTGYIDMITTAAESLADDPDAPFIMNETIMREWTEYLQDRDMAPEFQLLTYHGAENVKNWVIEPGVLDPPYFLNLITGPHAFYKSGPTAPFDVALDYIQTMKRSHPIAEDDMVFGAVVGGRNWLPLTVAAVLMGFDVVRVGMEDTAMLYPHEDDYIESCAQVVGKIATIAQELGREVASPAEAREILDT